jgi:hypothetical protein
MVPYEEAISLARSSMVGKLCWYASSGGSVGHSFQLALGQKVRRKRELRNKHHTAEYRKYEGEANLLVWSSWRLETANDAITSSDDIEDTRIRGLDSLIGLRVEDVAITLPCWDMRVSFSENIALCVFCDHVPGEPSYDGNWELWLRRQYLYAGPGARYDVCARDH